MNKNPESGIYCIENIINKKKYIGQTKNISRRKKQHFTTLNNNNHFNKHLQYSYNTYGKDVFHFIVLEKCSLEIIDEREIYWISYYDSINNGYNICDGGNTRKGYNVEEDMKEYLRNCHDESIEVIQLDLSGKFIKNFHSISEASKKCGVNIKNLKKCCKQQIRQTGGYIWVFKNDYDNNIDMSYYFENKKTTAKEVVQYTFDGRIINIYKKLKDIKIDGFNCSCVSDVCNGKRKSSGGYLWTYRTMEEGGIDINV